MKHLIVLTLLVSGCKMKKEDTVEAKDGGGYAIYNDSNYILDQAKALCPKGATVIFEKPGTDDWAYYTVICKNTPAEASP